MIIDHTNPLYQRAYNSMKDGRYTGAYYYSEEIVKNIIPNVKTDRNWVTINQVGQGYSHSIVFIHNNVNPGLYDWLKDFDDLILVCGVPSTCAKVKHLGKPIYLPLSVDVKYVEQFKREKKYKRAFAGRITKTRNTNFQYDVPCIYGKPREELLPAIAEYEQIYAVGRTAIEAKILDCEILTYDPRFPDPSFWRIIDNLEAARMLQELIDEIDK